MKVRLLTLFILSISSATLYAAVDPEVEKIKRHYNAAKHRLNNLKNEYRSLNERLEKMKSTNVVPNLVNGRLTPTSATPIPPLNTTTNNIIYFSPYSGNKVTLYYNSQWRIFVFSELSIGTSSLAAGSIYDIFIYRQSDTTLALEYSSAWASATTRTNALALQNGILVKSGSPDRRYLGTVRTNDGVTTYENSTTRRFLWNYYNRVPRRVRRFDSTDTWTYNSSTWQKVRADSNNRVEFVIGVNEVLVQASAMLISGAAGALRNVSTGIGVDSSTVNSASLNGGAANTETAAQNWAEYLGYPGIGYHDLSWLENSPDGSVTFWGDNGSTSIASGMLVWIDG